MKVIKKKRSKKAADYNNGESSDSTMESFSAAFPALAIKKAPLPPHQRKFTPHSYFPSTLRDLVAGKDQVVVIIPQAETEIQLRKRMFRIFKEQQIGDTKEYDLQLRNLIASDAVIKDYPFTPSIGKRYVYLKGDPAAARSEPPELSLSGSELMPDSPDAANNKFATQNSATSSTPTAASSTGKTEEKKIRKKPGPKPDPAKQAAKAAQKLLQQQQQQQHKTAME